MNFITGFMKVFNSEEAGITVAVMFSVLLLIGIVAAIVVYVERKYK